MQLVPDRRGLWVRKSHRQTDQLPDAASCNTQPFHKRMVPNLTHTSPSNKVRAVPFWGEKGINQSQSSDSCTWKITTLLLSLLFSVVFLSILSKFLKSARLLRSSTKDHCHCTNFLVRDLLSVLTCLWRWYLLCTNKKTAVPVPRTGPF